MLREGGDAILIATGSEVGIAMDAAVLLSDRGIEARVVSIPCTGVFEAQDDAYRKSVLPRSMRARVAVEAGVTAGWRAWVGEDGAVAGVDSFGKSAPWQHVYEHFGLTAQNVAAMVESVIARVAAEA